jgi:hypothetical protein
VKKSIKIFLGAELVVLATNFFSYQSFLNAQVAFLSSLFIFLGSMYSYKRLVDQRVPNEPVIEDERDELDKIDDPHALYEEVKESEQSVEELKAVLKEEKKQMKGDNIKNTLSSSKATASLYRLLPYLFLVFGFIALKNNHNLSIMLYLLFLTLGMPVGYLIGKEIFSPKQ